MTNPTTSGSTDRLPTPNTAEAASLYQRLRGHLAVLRLHDAAEALPTVLDQASAEDLSMTAALDRLLSIEVEATEARRLAGRLRFACLPTPASLEDFDYDAAAGVDRKVIEELATCRYLETATNVLLIGPPGVGKTHLSVGLARAAAHAGYRTYFTTAADLAARCHRAAIEGRWATTMRFYAGPTLLVIDELGYLPLPGEAAAALFQVVSQRYMKTSIVMTTNRGVGKAHLFARTCAEVALKRDMFAGIRVGRGGRAVGPRRGDRRDRSSLLRVSSRRLPRRVSGRSY
ncbi:ATP-binding protein [Mycolicibacterium aromaticivorans]|uniref:ATP-binding protein n=1 Tax=Mycolicibacterium aromaticivorans TaxID=318425 RepID=UPI0009E07820|nr:ATP-binding protein [Mycolicibacterium aromaticivorans]